MRVRSRGRGAGCRLLTLFAAAAQGCACGAHTLPRPRPHPTGELLDPLLPLLVRALRSRHAPSVTTALQALTQLMQTQLPGLQKTAAGAPAGWEQLACRAGGELHLPTAVLGRHSRSAAPACRASRLALPPPALPACCRCGQGGDRAAQALPQDQPPHRSGTREGGCRKGCGSALAHPHPHGAPSPTPPTHPAQDCFKLLGGMLRQCERWQPSQGQLRFLVTWAFGDLEETATRQNAFHLLKVRPGCGAWLGRRAQGRRR